MIVRKPKELSEKTEKRRLGLQLGTDNVLKLVLSLAIPSMIAQFVNVLYSIVDRIYIGNIPEIGVTALAGVGICGPIVALIASFAGLVGMGGAPLLSIKLGEKNRDGAKKILSNCFLTLIVLALILTLAVYLLKDQLLFWFGASDATYVYADEYLKWYVFGTLFAILSAGLNSFIIAQGFGAAGMATVLIGAALNIALDPLFIFTFGLGVKGAAIATVTSQFASAVFTIIFLRSKRCSVKIGFGNYDLKLIGKILLMGASPFLILATDSAMLLALNSVLQTYGGAGMGDKLITAATVMLSFFQIVTMPLAGITAGTQPILSFNYGARNGARVKKGEFWIVTVCVVFCTVMFLASRFLSEAFVRIFVSDEEVVRLSVLAIKAYTLSVIPMAFQYAFVDGMTALGKPQVAIALSMFRKLVIMLPLTFLLPHFLGAEATFYSEPIADLAAGIVSTTVFFLVINKILRKREKEGSASDLATRGKP